MGCNILIQVMRVKEFLEMTPVEATAMWYVKSEHNQKCNTAVPAFSEHKEQLKYLLISHLLLFCFPSTGKSP